MSDVKPVIWLHGEVTTPPFSEAARIATIALLKRVRHGEKLSLPVSRPMPSLGPRCHELRIRDVDVIHRVVYRTDVDAVVVADVFIKKTQQMPSQVIKNCKQRLRLYDQ